MTVDHAAPRRSTWQVAEQEQPTTRAAARAAERARTAAPAPRAAEAAPAASVAAPAVAAPAAAPVATPPAATQPARATKPSVKEAKEGRFYRPELYSTRQRVTSNIAFRVSAAIVLLGGTGGLVFLALSR